LSGLKDLLLVDCLLIVIGTPDLASLLDKRFVFFMEMLLVLVLDVEMLVGLGLFRL
jgi:hypothetical protein